MRHGRLALILATAAAACPASAGASVTFGADLRMSPNTGTGCFKTMTFAQTSVPLRSAAAPVTGVVVRWRLRGDGPPLPLRVLRATADGRYQGVGTSALENVTSHDDPYKLHTFDTRLPIERGDFLGVDLPADDPLSADHAAMLYAFFAPVGGWTTAPMPGAELRTFTPKLEDGTARIPGEDPWTQCLDRSPMILLINADIEPDGDHDGWGDETQDACPSNAWDHDTPCDATAPVAAAAPSSPKAQPKRKQASKRCSTRKRKHRGCASKRRR